MDSDVAVELLSDMVYVCIMLLLPPVGIALAVGLVIGLVQAITSIQEQTLSFVPKLLAVGIILIFLGSWMSQVLVNYTYELFAELPRFGAL